MSQGGVPDPNVRASDADRERIVEQLRQHTAEGRLTMDEFDQRMSAAYEAKTYGDLAQLTRDLPVDLGARSKGVGGVPPWQHTPNVGTGPGARTGTGTGGMSGTSPADVVGALVGAAMDFKLQSRQMRDQLRAQRHEQRHQLRPARRHGAPLVAAVAGWASLSVLLTGVWFISGLADSKGFGDFWPIWPIGFIGLIILARTVRGTIVRRIHPRR
jgi:hypothetical protein